MTTLDYLLGICNRLNDLNLNSQDRTLNRFSIDDKIKPFIKKLEMIHNNVSNENLQTFPNLEQFVIEHPSERRSFRKRKMLLPNANKTFEKYFKEDYSEFL